jgi:NAD(P)-dependent dehydrogenase (short-subunit alcohol dehydrogenase family)
VTPIAGFLPDLFAAQRVVVTGAAGGIGRAVCDAFVKAGAEVIGIDRDGAPGMLRCDLGDRTALQDVAQTVLSGGPIAALVNCAGSFRRVRLPDPDASGELDAALALQVVAPFLLTRILLPALRNGAVVNITSTSAERGTRDASAYSIGKAGLRMLTIALAAELAAEGVRVNAVAPGEVETSLTAGDPRVEAIIARIPMGRRAQPAEVAAAVVFLASPLASYITGATLAVDGDFLTV